jgi:hypothetical protein
VTAPDGSLESWDDIVDEHAWQILLLGNGLSINVWPGFMYTALFDHARYAGLTDEDLELFEGTPNFERVLGDLLTAIRVLEIVGLDSDPLYERYRRIQLALGHAIREVHLNRDRVPGATRQAIRDELCEYEWIFTTSYDLIIYWAMGYGGAWKPFIDGFKYGGRCEFDTRRFKVWQNEIPVFFLHGALHLVVGGNGVTWKLRRTLLDTILDQFGQPIPGDPQARPLLVTEGSARDKLRAIEGNDYLSFVLGRLRELALPLVVFGSSLSPEDQHLVDALNEHPDRPIAVSMRPSGTKRQRAAQQGDLYGRLEAETLLFFDSTTHPLGSPDLKAA